LWRSDGTVSGTVIIKDIKAGISSGIDTSDAQIIHNGVIYLTADDGIHGEEFWSTDETESRTNMIKDLVPGRAYPEFCVYDLGFRFIFDIV
jgi:ELWxxDGT repeat protein